MTAAVGFDGKLPSRGDFIGRGLPRSFLTPWQAWIDAGLAASRKALGEAWFGAWMEAPIWHFALPGGAAGPDAVLGLWLPSVDRANRHYPLTVAAVFPGQAAAPDLEAGAAWLAAVETLALQALAQDHAPEVLAQALAALPPPVAGQAASGAWRTTGSPRVPTLLRTGDSLPAPAGFAAMIDAGIGDAARGRGRGRGEARDGDGAGEAADVGAGET
jgi:type VI secretion system protein ImpM